MRKTTEAPKPRGAKRALRAASGVLVLIALAAAAGTGSPAAATLRSTKSEIRPTVRIRPRIVGTPRVGVTLKAMPGAWRPSGSLVYRYRWLRCPAGGAKCMRIGHAASRRYTPTNVDVATTLRVAVTAANAAGFARSTSRRTGFVRPSGKTPFVARWHMDETSGNVMHDSAGTHDGTLQAVQIGLPGFSGMAYGFNGRNSVVSVPAAADLNPGTSNIILTIRLKTTDVPGLPPKDADLIRKGSYAPSEYKVELQHSGQASCGFAGSAGYGELIAGPRVNDGRWHRVQCIKAATAIQLVVDGKRFTQHANVGSIGNTAPVVIGAHPDGDFYSGTLDDVSIQVG